MINIESTKGGKNMANKGNKSQIWVRILALILAMLMLLSVAGTLVYYIIAR